MFQLAKVRDIVRVLPEFFSLDQTDAVKEIVSQKYANKVIHNVGLCIRVFDLVHVSEPLVHSCQDGAYTTQVVFRLVVFRPFQGEVLIGEIRSSSAEGINVSLDFFDDILIPAGLLQPSTVFDPIESQFVWNADEDTKLPYGTGTTIRFKVESEIFKDVGPLPAATQIQSQHRSATSVDATVNSQPSSVEPTFVPYRIIGSASEEGFGSPTWWLEDEVEEDSAA